MKIYYVDGQFVESNQAMIPVDDLAILRGYGVCDIMRTFNGSPFLIQEHIDRLFSSAKGIGLALPWTPKDLVRIVRDTLDKNTIEAEVNIRIVVTAGSSPDFMSPAGSPRLIVLITDIPPLPEHWYTKGIKVITLRQERSIPQAKVISYITAAMALKQAREQHADEAIYINPLNQALEGTTSNLFAIFGNRLLTPATGILHGITRKAVLTVSKKICQTVEAPIGADDLLNADEVFITGTNKGVVPVVRVDDTRIGNGLPGAKTTAIMKALEAFGSGRTPSGNTL